MQAQVVADVDLRASHLAHARSVVRRVPLWGLVDSRVKDPEQVVTSAFAGLGLDTSTVRAASEWIGPSGGVAAWSAPIRREVRGSDPAVAWVAWVHTRRGKRAEDALRAQLAFSPLETYRSVKMYRVASPTPEGASQIVSARIHDSMLFASSSTALKASIDAATDGALEATPAYQRVMEPAFRDAEPIARISVRSGAATLLESAAAQQGSATRALLGNTMVRAWLSNARDTAAQLGVDDEGARVAVSYPADGAARDPRRAVAQARSLLQDAGRSIGVQLPGGLVRMTGTSSSAEQWAITVDPTAIVDTALPELDPRVGVVLRGQISHVGTMRVSGSTVGSGATSRRVVRIALPLVE